MENQPTSKTLRIVELLLVIGVAFAATIFVSIYSLFSSTLTPNLQAGQALMFYGLVYFGDVALRPAINEGSVDGPRMYVSGPGLSPEGGQFPGLQNSHRQLAEEEYRIVNSLS